MTISNRRPSVGLSERLVTDFTLPELGENIAAGDVLRVLVKPGDTLAKDQPVLELETDKATIEVPSSVAGQVKDVKVKAGDKVKVGQAILSVEDDARRQAARRAPAAPKPLKPKRRRDPSAAPAPKRLVGGQRRPRRRARHKPRACRRRGRELPRRIAAEQKVVDISRGARPSRRPAALSERPAAPAAPSVRRMARELGVDINQVAGSGSERPHLGRRRQGARQAAGHGDRVGAGAVRLPWPPSRCPTSPAGARSSASRCAPCGARPPST